MTPGPRSRHRELTDFLAFALAIVFLVRTFVGEPFGIPTGSMAPTLLGEHKLIRCLACGKEFPVSKLGDENPVVCRCPACETTLDITDAPLKPGNRIIVLKGPPTPLKRWDVAVFKHVDEPRKLYVKRIVGLPGERLRIRAGEIEIWNETDQNWRIAQKPAEIRAIHYTQAAEGVDSTLPYSQLPREFSIGPRQYFALGDNSPQSIDSRHWKRSQFVEERMIVGRVPFKFGR